MAKRLGLWLLKLIGVGLFVLILNQIDRSALKLQLEQTNMIFVGLSFLLLFLVYFCKAKRFAVLVHQAGTILPFQKHWQIFNTGVFLAGITPGKIGEMGRAAYLKAEGMNAGIAIVLMIIDRILDVVFIAILTVVSAGILFGWQWAVIGALVMGIGFSLALLIRRASTILRTHITATSIAPVTLWTVASWTVYFTWAITLAYTVGIHVPVMVLFSALVFAGILALLPIAPSGLGTRDATLVFLLAPYGVPAEQAVALALLMFISIILSSFLGGWYFVKGVR